MGEILSELVLRNGIGNRACEPWLLWEAITKSVQRPRPMRTHSGEGRHDGQADGKSTNAGVARHDDDEPAGRLARFGLLTTTPEAKDDAAGAARSGRGGKGGLSRLPSRCLSDGFWTLAQLAFTVFVAARAVAVAVASAIAAAATLPPRSSRNWHAGIDTRNDSAATDDAAAIWSDSGREDKAGRDGKDVYRSVDGRRASLLAPPPHAPVSSPHQRLKLGSGTTNAPPDKRPILGMSVWSCLSALLELDRRTPWLSGFLSLAQVGAVSGPAKVGDTDGPVDR